MSGMSCVARGLHVTVNSSNYILHLPYQRPCMYVYYYSLTYVYMYMSIPPETTTLCDTVTYSVGING